MSSRKKRVCILAAKLAYFDLHVFVFFDLDRATVTTYLFWDIVWVYVSKSADVLPDPESEASLSSSSRSPLADQANTSPVSNNRTSHPD